MEKQCKPDCATKIVQECYNCGFAHGKKKALHSYHAWLVNRRDEQQVLLDGMDPESLPRDQVEAVLCELEDMVVEFELNHPELAGGDQP